MRVLPAVRVDQVPGPIAANETSIAASAANPLVVVAGWNDSREQPGRSAFGLSRDGGASWIDFLIRPDSQTQGAAEGDPMVAGDPRTGTLWAGAISFGLGGGMYVARLSPGDAAFGPSIAVDTSPGLDKCWMAAGPDPTDASLTRVYVAYNFGVAHSADMGDTWQAPVPLDRGVGFLPRVGPQGQVYVAYWDFDTKHLLCRSYDGGLTFGPPITMVDRMDVYGTQINDAVVGGFRAPSNQGFAVDPSSGHLYCVYMDTTSQTGTERDVDIYFTRSVDEGLTWSTPSVINGDEPFEQDQFFPWIEVDEYGGLHVLYLDTRHNQQLDDAVHALIDAYYAYSSDSGATWEEHRLTPESWDSSETGLIPPFPFIGDYVGLSTAGGRAVLAYPTSNAITKMDIESRVVLYGPGQAVCRGILCPCGNDDPSAGCGNAGLDGDPATGASLAALGTPLMGADDLVLEFDGLDAGQFLILFAGTSTGSALAGNGRLCIGGSLARYPILQANPSGRATLGPGQVVSQAQSAALPFGPAPGETWYYQALYRDGAGPCGAGLNATSALSILWE